MAKWRHGSLSISDKTPERGKRSMISATYFFRLLHDAQTDTAIGTDMETAPRPLFAITFILNIKRSLRSGCSPTSCHDMNRVTSATV
jgi:hypothetical protein